MAAEKVIYTNSRGQSIELTNRMPFLLESVEGKGDVSANVQMQSAPFQDGSTFIDTTLETRVFELIVNIKTNSRDELNAFKQQISSIFNPRLGLGKLIYSNGNVKREIEVVSTSVPVFPTGEAKGKWFQRTVINLVAPNPYWQGLEIENHKLEDFVGSFKFPFHLPMRFSSRGDSRVLFNSGDVPTPIQVEFRGVAVNPKITNMETGEFIRVNRTIEEGYKLIINTAFGNKRVEIIAPDGTVTNAFHYIDLDSTFFSLDVGNTKIGFIADGGNPEVYVTYKNRYLSV